jgi:hypothetical protein
LKWATASTGKVVQIVNATNSTQTLNVYHPPLPSPICSASITPSSSSNKVLVLVTHGGCGKYNGQVALQVRLLRGSTTILNIGGNDASTGTTGENMIGTDYGNY